MAVLDLTEALDFAIRTAQAAGALTLEYFRHFDQPHVRPQAKADNTPVTIADRQAEELIRLRIQQRYPQHAILGEEFGGGEEAVGDRPRWVIDPIDGTRSFIAGVPLYGVLLGLEVDGQIRVGVAHFPAVGETLAAAQGLGCTWNERTPKMSGASRLADALVLHGNEKHFAAAGKGAAWERLKARAARLSGWSDAYGYLLVATGRADVMIDPRMNTWDCGPFPVIFNELGGYFGDWAGRRTIYGGEAVAAPAALMPELLDVLRREETP